MLKTAVGLIIGVFLGLGLGQMIPLKDSDSRLIESWRGIQPGMLRAEVERILGPSSYNEGPPQEARSRFPESYWSDHTVQTYIVKGPGPHLLFVAFDRDGRVSFVSSSAT